MKLFIQGSEKRSAIFKISCNNGFPYLCTTAASPFAEPAPGRA
jgi:hypothetical protein